MTPCPRARQSRTQGRTAPQKGGAAQVGVISSTGPTAESAMRGSFSDERGKSLKAMNQAMGTSISLSFHLVSLIVPGIVYDNAGTREMSHIAGYED